MKNKTKSVLAARRNRYGYVFIVPWIIGFLLFFLLPLGQSIYYSFCKVSPSDAGFSFDFIRLENYRYLFEQDTTYKQNLWESVKSFLYSLPLTVILSLVLAVILNQKFRGRLLARAVFFLPVIIATGVVLEIFNTDVMAEQVREGSNSYITGGIDFALILTRMDLPPNLVEPMVTFIEEIFDLVWGCGVQTILFIAGLQSVPEHLYEVSRVEGSTGWEDFWFITLPMLSNILILVIVYSIIDFFTKCDNPVMDQVYSAMIGNQNYDLSSAMLWVYFAIVGAVIAIFMFLLRHFLLRRWDQ